MAASGNAPTVVITEVKSGVVEPEQPEQQQQPEPKRSVGFCEIASSFVLMGWTAFGGPAAHVGLFQKTFVEQQRWMSLEVFMELFAVCQCMPGPSSTQMSFALGTAKQGVPGGLLSGVLFQYPGFLVMTVLGLTVHGWASEEVIRENSWLAGMVGALGAAGVALVASAAVGLWNKACAQPDAKVLAGFCCVVLLYFSAEFIAPAHRDGRKWMWIFPVLIIIGGIFTFVWRGPLEKKPGDVAPRAEAEGIEHFGVGRVVGTGLILFVALIFVASFVLSSALEYEEHRLLHWFAAFWRTGTVIWGGGQVVLPLLENEVVPTGWIESTVFFSGLALAQAMPGPLFNFAAFLGAAAGYRVASEVGGGVAGACVCWLGLFGPGVILIFGILPLWGSFRSNATYKRALPGLNASAVGLLLASVVQMAAAVREKNTKPAAFVFYFAGHCKTLRSYDLSKSVNRMKAASSKAFCLVDQNGQSCPESWLKLHDFARLVTSTICRRVKVLLVLDCCGDRGAADIDALQWEDQEVLSISTFNGDTQTQGNCGNARFTESLLRVVERLNREGRGDCSMGQLHDELLEADACMTEQGDISVSLQARPSKLKDEMQWPFLPQGCYAAPCKKESAHAEFLRESSSTSAPESNPNSGATSTGPDSPAASFATVDVFQRALVCPERAPPLKDADPLDDPFCLHAGAGIRTLPPSLARESSGATSAPRLHLVICALDTETTAYAAEGAHMVDLARHCSATSVESLFNESATIPNLERAIERIGRECRPEDRFVFFYAGGGPTPTEAGGASTSGLSFADEAGGEAQLSGDGLARLLTRSLHPATDILVLADCLHSGAVANLGREEWASHRAVLLSGCPVMQSSAEPEISSGVLTKCLLEAVSTLKPHKKKVQSVGVLYNAMLKCIADSADGSQDITIQATRGVSPFLTAWPLWPSCPYEAPIRTLTNLAFSESSEILTEVIELIEGLDGNSSASGIPGALCLEGDNSTSSRKTALTRRIASVHSPSPASMQDAMEPNENWSLQEPLPTLLTTAPVATMKAPMKDTGDRASKTKKMAASPGQRGGGNDQCDQSAVSAELVAAQHLGPARPPEPRRRKRDRFWQMLLRKPSKA